MIPVRHDLERFLFEYLDAAGLRDAGKGTPLFSTAVRKEKWLSGRSIHVNDLCRMVKRRMKDAGLPNSLSAHSFRVTVITDLLTQGVDLADVQRLAVTPTRGPLGCTIAGISRSHAMWSREFQSETALMKYPNRFPDSSGGIYRVYFR